MIPRPQEPLVVALDVAAMARAEELAARLAPHVGMLKVGFELFWAHGPEAVRLVGAHAPVFADAKLHDIPTTVSRAAERIAALGVAMLDVHATGGPAMMRAAVEGAGRGADGAGVPRPLVIAVTRLSSLPEDGGETSVALAAQAQDAGLDGVVVSGPEVASVRAACGEAFCLVVPGIRTAPPRAEGTDDQIRTLTPAEALAAGADYLVVGRPVTGADDPVAAAERFTADAR